MPKYRALEPIAHARLGMIERGQTFECDMEPGIAWEPVDAAAKAKVGKEWTKPPEPSALNPLLAQSPQEAVRND